MVVSLKFTCMSRKSCNELGNVQFSVCSLYARLSPSLLDLFSVKAVKVLRSRFEILSTIIDYQTSDDLLPLFF